MWVVHNQLKCLSFAVSLIELVIQAGQDHGGKVCVDSQNLGTPLEATCPSQFRGQVLVEHTIRRQLFHCHIQLFHQATFPWFLWLLAQARDVVNQVGMLRLYLTRRDRACTADPVGFVGQVCRHDGGLTVTCSFYDLTRLTHIFGGEKPLFVPSAAQKRLREEYWTWCTGCRSRS